ncbi:nitrogenase (molybdenum-iron) alpha chain [Sporolactobacillus inulinus]|uniref:nitrogenase n=1 Tax=Sporolactobacillus inulinus TaxID=2078 RepID=A0A4Y1Z9S1_9BACL|nr:nitrogenase (molybdenum-iron) alpha chain [Sporolactobacillus inulinus]
MSVREDLLAKYSSKVYKNREKHLVQLEDVTNPQEIAANKRAIPGVMTARGCCYAGCKGVVLGPLKDVCIIVHGAIGCSFYTWNTRRNKSKADENSKGQNFVPYCFSTDMQESDIIFGGEKSSKRLLMKRWNCFIPTVS